MPLCNRAPLGRPISSFCLPDAYRAKFSDHEGGLTSSKFLISNGAQEGFEPPTPSLRRASSTCRDCALRSVSVRESTLRFICSEPGRNALRRTSCNHSGTTRTAETATEEEPRLNAERICMLR